MAAVVLAECTGVALGLGVPLPSSPYEVGCDGATVRPLSLWIHHITCSSAIGGIAPTFGRTKPMKARVGSSGSTMKCSEGSGSCGA